MRRLNVKREPVSFLLYLVAMNDTFMRVIIEYNYKITQNQAIIVAVHYLDIHRISLTSVI